jgi:hypothetical protein
MMTGHGVFKMAVRAMKAGTLRMVLRGRRKEFVELNSNQDAQPWTAGQLAKAKCVLRPKLIRR